MSVSPRTTTPYPPDYADETASLATARTTSSTFSPLLNPTSSPAAQQAADFSFTGKPLNPAGAGCPGTMLMFAGDAGFAAGAAGAAGANIAKPRFDGPRTIKIPIKKADLRVAGGGDDDDGAREGRAQQKKGGLFSRHRAKKEEKGFVMVSMSSAEYRAWWAKNEDGSWMEGVTEPPGGRADWVKMRMEG